MTLPVEILDNKDHYLLSPREAMQYIEENGVTIDQLKSLIPNSKKEPEEKKAIDANKRLDKAHNWDATKLRATVKCDDCGASRCIYSKFAVGSKNGPTSAEEEIRSKAL